MTFSDRFGWDQCTVHRTQSLGYRVVIRLVSGVQIAESVANEVATVVSERLAPLLTIQVEFDGLSLTVTSPDLLQTNASTLRRALVDALEAAGEQVSLDRTAEKGAIDAWRTDFVTG